MNNNYMLSDNIIYIYIIYKEKTYIAKVDSKNFDLVNQGIKWGIHEIKGKLYVRCAYLKGLPKEKRKRIYLHRLILNPSDENVIDHLDGNPLNNLEDNLLETNQSVNMFNRQGSQINSTTGFRNVTKSNKTNKFNVKIQFKGKVYQKYGFDTAELANEYAEKTRAQIELK